MAFYNPPGAPQQGGQTVDSSRYMEAAPPPVVNPFDAMYKAKQQELEMKSLQRQEKAQISAEELAKMQEDIFTLGDRVGKFNPDALLEGGKFNAAELQKRLFTDDYKSQTWETYKSNAEVAGGVANRQQFELAWAQGKNKEDNKVVNEMWLDVQSNRMDEKDFNLALRNPQFRNYWKDMSVESKAALQANFDKASWKKGYDPGYQTFWEGMTGRGEEGTYDLEDQLTSPIARTVGYTSPIIGAGIAAAVSPEFRGLVKKGYGMVRGEPLKDFKAQRGKLADMRSRARDLGFDRTTGKYGRGRAWSDGVYQKSQKALREFNKSADAKELKGLKALKKAGDPFNEQRFDELNDKHKRLKSTVKSARTSIRKAKARLSTQEQMVKGAQDKARHARGVLGETGQALGRVGAGYWRGLGAMGVGELAAMPTRMLLGDDTKGKKLTNEGIETIATQAGMGRGQVAMLKSIKSKIGKKGMAWALKKIATKGGLKLATSVGAKAILGSVGGVLSGGTMTVVAGGLLAKDLYDIAQILSE